MNTSKSAAAAGQADQQSSALAVRDTQLLAQFAEMAAIIPAEQGDGTESILRQILAAETWEDLSTPWSTSDVDDIVGKPMKLESATRRPSALAGGLGIFLVCHLLDPKTGKRLVKVTGSVAIVGIIARAYAINAMPLMVVWRKSERPTDAGFYPQHLDVIDSFGPGRGESS